MRIIGLDVGDKTIGIALSDPLGITAQGISTYERVGIKKDTGHIVDMIRSNDCDTVVVGLPLNLDGSDSIQTEKVREFAEKLGNKLKSNGLAHVEVVFQDERLTTVQAERVMIEADLSRAHRKKIVDRQAAIIILQSYMDSKATHEASK